MIRVLLLCHLPDSHLLAPLQSASVLSGLGLLWGAGTRIAIQMNTTSPQSLPLKVSQRRQTASGGNVCHGTYLELSMSETKFVLEFSVKKSSVFRPGLSGCMSEGAFSQVTHEALPQHSVALSHFRIALHNSLGMSLLRLWDTMRLLTLWHGTGLSKHAAQLKAVAFHHAVLGNADVHVLNMSSSWQARYQARRIWLCSFAQAHER
jgi:hypothetical protein